MWRSGVSASGRCVICLLFAEKSNYADLLFDVSRVLPENSFWEAVKS